MSNRPNSGTLDAMIEELRASCAVPSLIFFNISSSLPSWPAPNTTTFALSPKLRIDALGEFVGARLEQRTGLAVVAELQLELGGLGRRHAEQRERSQSPSVTFVE